MRQAGAAGVPELQGLKLERGMVQEGPGSEFQGVAGRAPPNLRSAFSILAIGLVQYCS